MEFEAETESSSRLPLFSSPRAHMESPERSGTLTPPLHASGSVPFRWEEEPGKPKSCCTTLATFCNDHSARKCLELPPRLLMDHHVNKNTKLTSPTTVLEGPYISSRARFQSSSFRIGSECYGSFRATGSFSPETENYMGHHGDGDQVLSKREISRDKGFVGSGRRRREVVGNSYVFPSLGDNKGEEYSMITRTRRIRSSHTLSHSKSHFWASIYEGLKQVVPWSKRDKRDRFMG